jgi:HD-GYP domain-containing protein (c-di-GMP phosphodiesterase class II)
MSDERQVWYVPGSLGEKAVTPLRDVFDLSPVAAANPDPAPLVKSHKKSIPVVLLIDVKPGGTVIPRLDHTSARYVRVLGVIPVSEKPSQGGTIAGEPHANAFFAYLSANAPPAIVEKTLNIAFESMEMAKRERLARRLLERAERERELLNEIGITLSTETDISSLLKLILQKAREITCADAGSLYLVEDEPSGERFLRFMFTQNDTTEFPFEEVRFPLTEDSMAGYSALRSEVLNFADAYRIPRGCPYHFNDRYDRESGYRTKSLLTLPMKNPKGEVLGVLQLINAKRNPRQKLRLSADVPGEVRPFRKRSVRLVLSLASQAAVAYENRKLYGDVENLFEGFVHAAVTAIEQRDPTTSGHSLRVCNYTIALAEIVDRAAAGPYADAHFTREQMKEIRYAALLHDFGKVGVREKVLLKAKKLYPLQLEIVRQRFDYIRKETEAAMVRRKLQVYLERDRGDALAEIARLSEDFEQRLKKIEEYLRCILDANEPAMLEQALSSELSEISNRFFLDPRGIEKPYLDPGEVRLLSIPQGSLDATERKEIESHVFHTFSFLAQIPWTKDLRNIPEIAKAHHEKLNGSGYPFQLRAGEIPFPAKMMTICDIFDALTASDRPYKSAVSNDRALRILEESVKENELDAELYRLFCEARIYELGGRSTGK